MSTTNSETNNTINFNKIINRVTDLNRDFYKLNDYKNNEIIESLIVYICRKHAINLDEDSQFYWDDKEMSVTDNSDIDVDELISGSQDEVEYIKNRVKICSDCLKNASETEQKMEAELRRHFPWLNEIRHSIYCKDHDRDDLKFDLCRYIKNNFSWFQGSDKGLDFEDFINDTEFSRKFEKLLFSYEESIRKKTSYEKEKTASKKSNKSNKS